ncbi:MAG: GNAT family N-acetyltransferase [Pseudolysinimonas sp.]
MTSTFTIDEVAIPRSIAEDRDGVFGGMMAIRNAVEVAAYGIPEVAVSPEEMLPHYLDENEPKRVLLARVDGAIVGRAIFERQLDDDEVGWLEVQVLPEFQGRGIGRALTDAIEDVAREYRRSRLITYVVSADAPGDRLLAPTGFGSVPAANREVRFLLARRWTLEQVERGSRFALPADSTALAALRAAAEEHSDGYRVLTWAGATPPELLDDLAILQTRMSTDAPNADLGEPPDVWTAERFATKEALLLDAPQQLLTAAALHEPSGRLGGFTRLCVPHDASRAVGQWDTIVLGEHRGHRLGMLLKVANLQQLSETAPGHPSVLTWNDEENRHMLSVNEAVGFVPIGYEGAWKKTL